MIRNSNYSKFLTVLLIIAIIAIVALLGFFGFDMYKKYYLDTEAGKIVQQFEGSIITGEDEEIVSNIITGDTVENPFSEMEDVPFSDGGSGNGSGSQNVVKYEDYIVLGTIKIPKTGREYPILNKVTKRSLEIAVATIYSPGVNKVGNTVIMGHNYRNGLFFSNNKMLELGDKIYITDMSGKTITYTVYNKYETDETDAEYMTRDTAGKREISLSTCTDEGNKRLIIWAREG